MTLSRAAQEFALEIRNHDWADAPWRLDRAGHKRATDSKRPQQALDERETDHVRTNVMWVTAQVLQYSDPNFNILEFAEACGIPRRITHNSDGRPSGGLSAGLRVIEGNVARPGSWESDSSSAMDAKTRIALKNYDYVIRSRGLGDASIDWESETFIYGDGGASFEGSLLMPGFTPATA